MTGKIDGYNRTYVKIGNSVDLTSYTSTPYICPTDGYVILLGPGGTGTARFSGLNTFIASQVTGDGITSTFVRKGTDILFDSVSSSADARIFFRGIQIADPS